jgi:hypothetical protein
MIINDINESIHGITDGLQGLGRRDQAMDLEGLIGHEEIATIDITGSPQEEIDRATEIEGQMMGDDAVITTRVDFEQELVEDWLEVGGGSGMGGHGVLFPGKIISSY